MNAVRRFWLFLLPGVFHSAVSILLLPFSTLILGPREYGLFALLSALTGFVAVFANFGAGYLLSTHYLTLAGERRRTLVSSLVWGGLITGILLSSLLLFGWSHISAFFPELSQIGRGYPALSTLAMALTLPWSIAADVVRLDGRAHLYALASIGQSVISAVALLTCLFYFELGAVSLFLASVAGALVLGLGAVAILSRELTLRIDRSWLKEMVRFGSNFFVASAAETVHQVLERSVLSARSGLSDLGIYTHSQQYRGIASMPAKAVANSVWPITLSEARVNRSDFVPTRLAWNAVYLLLTCVGLAIATLGSHLIALLTNNKFTEAYLLASLWIVYLLVQNTGKPQTGVYYALGAGVQFARIQTISMAVGTVLLFVLVPSFGIYGAFLAALIQQVALRVGVHFGARRLRQTPFQDHWAIAGALVVLITLWLRHVLDKGLVWNLTILFFALGAFTLVAHRVLAETWTQLSRRR